MVYIEHKDHQEDIKKDIEIKLLELDKNVEECWAGSIIEAMNINSALNMYLYKGLVSPYSDTEIYLSDDDYHIYSHELRETIKEFTNKCRCFNTSINGETFP